MNKVGIAIVSPSAYAPDEEAYFTGLRFLESQSCKVYSYYSPEKKYLRFGATDEERIKQIHEAAKNDDVKIILALRGGYGCSRIIPHLDFNLLADSGKLLVGFSDITALHLAMLAKANACSFAGPMLCSDFGRNPICMPTCDYFWQCVTSPSHTVYWEIPKNDVGINEDIDVSGTLWGGNLSIFTHLLGTPYFPKIKDGILFLEDVNEHPYRIERMMLQLFYAGVLSGQRAIVLGDFSGVETTGYDNGYNVETMLSYLRSVIPTPILTGLPFGHIERKITLAVGSKANLYSSKMRCTLEMTDYPYVRK